MQFNQNFSGTLRIKNPKTLQKWKDTGKYQELINKGYFYCQSCGRFRIGDINKMSKCCKKSFNNLQNNEKTNYN